MMENFFNSFITIVFSDIFVYIVGIDVRHYNRIRYIYD